MVGLGTAAILVLALLAFGFWRTGARAAELRQTVAAEEADSVRLASVIELSTMLRARQDTITQKIEIIRGVDSRRYVWPHLLDEISRALPPYVWLTRLGSAGDAGEGGPVFNLEGNAGSTQALTRFMRELEASPFIRDVTLVTSDQATAEGRTFQRFTLEAGYETPDPIHIETVPLVAP